MIPKPSGKKVNTSKTAIKVTIDPKECPFREFRDTEISPDFWGMGPAVFRSASLIPKMSGKGAPQSHATHGLWVDDQIQPLPNSVRQYLHDWVRAEELAESRWEAEVVIFEEDHGGKMSLIDFQFSHNQVLLRSTFCRRVMAYCYILERLDIQPVEHQWEGFNITFGPEGWRAKYHIYSPGMKAGGGGQHKPSLSKSGCYLVRLYYLGAWRCVWVSDQVPVDATGAPLLPFTPLSSASPVKGKGIPAMVTSPYVHLWPLLLVKALLKLAAPEMSGKDEDMEAEEGDIIADDELIPEFDMLHALTGSLSMVYPTLDPENLWEMLIKEVPVFSWDDDDDMQSSAAKAKPTKKANPKDKDTIVKKFSIVTATLEDTEEQPPYLLPGITPCHEMNIVVTQVRDIPLKKPLPEPEVPLWKTYRWVDWARSHGLYEAYDCPRTRYVKVNGLMKLSYAAHLQDVQSTESITYCFRVEQTEKPAPPASKKGASVKETPRTESSIKMAKEELREWVLFDSIQTFMRDLNIVYHTTMFEFTSAASLPPLRITKVPMKGIDIAQPKSAPLYLQLDGPEENILKISLNMLHPRILNNSGVPIVDYIDKAYVLLERFEWFVDQELPMPKAYVATRGYDTIEVKFEPGRHFCSVGKLLEDPQPTIWSRSRKIQQDRSLSRSMGLWVHSLLHWHIAMISESAILLGTRDAIQAAAIYECPWASKFLNNLGFAITNWIKPNRSTTNVVSYDQEFHASYQPDLTWNPKIVGYDKAFVHWMFRAALQSFLHKRLTQSDYQQACAFLRSWFHDPDFGFPPKPKPPKSLREIVDRDPCDCVMPEAEERLEEEEHIEEQSTDQENEGERTPLVGQETMDQLLKEPHPPVTSQVCELATEEVACGVLKIEREKVIKKHEAATLLQAHWRGAWARKCLGPRSVISTEVNKILADNVYGTLELLSALMNEFFLMFPGAKYAYSVSSALAGVYGLNQHSGVSPITPRCKWVPYFQGIFYCHCPVKVHFDIHSTIQHSTVQVYDNDTGNQLPQTYNAHVTFDFHPNRFGYTVLGHGSLNKPIGRHSEAHWQLTVMTSIDNVFHVCDNPDTDLCTELPLTPSSKLHIDEMFIPNRRNILGGIQISVTRVESVSFRAAASTFDLEMEAILRSNGPENESIEIDRCKGKGEIFWPFISLKPASQSNIFLKKKSFSTNYIRGLNSQGALSSRSLKQTKGKLNKNRSSTKIVPTKLAPVEPKTYTIEVIATNGWPLKLEQWKRVDEVCNDIEIPKSEVQPTKKAAKEKVPATKDKKEEKRDPEKIPIIVAHQPQPEDAFTELECSTTVGGGAYARRDDDRDILFATARRNWDSREPGRNLRGAKIREEFREEFLVPVSVPKSESTPSEALEEYFGEYEHDERVSPAQPGPTPETDLLDLEPEPEEEEVLYYTMPEQLREKFVSLYFVSLCTREKTDEESVLLTDTMAEAAKIARQAWLEASMERMRELQTYNEKHVLGRQKKRCKLLEELGVDAAWNTALATVMEERDDAIAREIAEIALAKKKMEAKPKPDVKLSGKK